MFVTVFVIQYITAQKSHAKLCRQNDLFQTLIKEKLAFVRKMGCNANHGDNKNSRGSSLKINNTPGLCLAIPGSRLINYN